MEKRERNGREKAGAMEATRLCQFKIVE